MFNSDILFQRARNATVSALLTGDNALPTEYVFIPTDYVLNTLYRGYEGEDPTAWNETELSRMYTHVATAFEVVFKNTVLNVFERTDY